MARIAPLPPESQTLLTRVIRWIMRQLFGRDARPYGIWAHAPRAVPAVFALNALLETGTWAIEPSLRKLVHLRVAQLIGCVF
jgi:alkylhydroperoxidase family enzyme